MKWVLACVLVLFLVAPAMAGQDPYIAVVGNDVNAVVPQGSTDSTLVEPFYFSPKYEQFFFDEGVLGILDSLAGPFRWGLGENFAAQNVIRQPEVCDLSGYVESLGVFSDRGFPNAKVTAGNAGWYEWAIRLPKKPTGEINLVLQCGVVKPNAFALWEYQAVELCAAETGEKVGPNCSHLIADPGEQPIVPGGLPMITAVAFPGKYNVQFTPFNLTAYKNPSTYGITFDATGAIVNNGTTQVLDGSTAARILLKSCMDKAVVVKIPVTGQVNALGQVENDLEQGDYVFVRMAVPRKNTVDVYCHALSLRLQGIGEAPF